MTNCLRIFFLMLLLCLSCCAAFAQTNVFTYQGKLTDNNGNPLSGNFDFEFRLFDTAPIGTGTQLGIKTFSNLTVNGVFTVEIDFPRCDVCFGGGQRWLEISVRTAGVGSFTQLTPRQSVTATPYAIRSFNAGNADFLSCSHCVTSDQISSVDGSTVVGQLAPEVVPPGSAHYIQNRTTPQSTSDFNISGNGTAGGTLSGNAVNVTTEFRWNGSRILSSGGAGNLFVGFNAGLNSTGVNNTYIGTNAGRSSGNLLNASAIGAFASVTQAHSLVLGAIKGVNECMLVTNCDSVNVGIGTTAPAYRLDVVGRIRLKQNTGDSGNVNTAGLWLFENTPNVDRAFIGMMDDSYVGLFGNNGANWGLVMNTQNGRIGMGTTSPDQTLTIGVGTASKPGGGSWAIFSDERLKNIKGSFTPGLKAVMQLQPIRYEYKPQNALEIKSTDEYIGFSAQAVQKIIPEAVIRNDKGYLLINNDPIIWTMLNAIKEQQAQIENLRVVNEALQLKVRAIEKRFRRRSR